MILVSRCGKRVMQINQGKGKGNENQVYGSLVTIMFALGTASTSFARVEWQVRYPRSHFPILLDHIFVPTHPIKPVRIRSTT